MTRVLNMNLRLAAAVLLLISSLARAAGAAPAPSRPTRVYVYIVGAGDGEPALAAGLHDLLRDEATSVVVVAASTFRGDEPFGTDFEAAAPAAWLILETTRARVRAAGAERTRFVFRDLEVGQPLTEFDRERLGQTVKAALGTLVSGGPGALSRADAAAASGVTLAAALPPPVVREPAAQPPVPEPRFRLGAFYQAASLGNGLFHGPGLIATLSGSGRSYDPELWLAGGYDLRREFGNQLASLNIDALWMRAGLNLRVADSVRVGAGLGIDRVTQRFVALDPRVQGDPDDGATVLLVGRLAARAGPARVAGVDVSLTAFLDVSRSMEKDIYVALESSTEFQVTLYRSNELRPGFSLDLWWR